MQAGLDKIAVKKVLENNDVIRLADYLMRIVDAKRYWVEALKNSHTEFDTIYSIFKIETISKVQESLTRIVQTKLKYPTLSINDSYKESLELALRELEKLDQSYRSYEFKLLIG